MSLRIVAGFPFPFCMMQHCETLKKRCYAKPKKSAKYVFFDLACDAVMENFILNFHEIATDPPVLPVPPTKVQNRFTVLFAK